MTEFDTGGPSADIRSMPATKGIRLNAQLRDAFERYCRDHLLDERAVVEAWLLKFLESSEEERRAVAKRYADWVTQQKEATSDRGARGRRPGRSSKPQSE